MSFSTRPSWPYTSAVSKKFSPRSTARSIMRNAVFSSQPISCKKELSSASPKTIVPRQRDDTLRPLLPKRRYCIILPQIIDGWLTKHSLMHNSHHEILHHTLQSCGLVTLCSTT